MALAKAPGQGGVIAPPDPWDPLVRISHWAVAAAVIANYFLNKPGGIWHVWIGWAVLGLLGIRLIWGFIGPSEARFSAFPPDPRAAIGHVFDLFGGRVREHGSHNPAGAIMVYALWACLATVTATGLIMTGAKSPVTIAEEKAAVAAGDWSVLAKDSEGGETEADDNDRSVRKAAVEVHEVAANLMVILALLHVAGVAVESRALGRNLVRPMVVGRRRRR